MIIPRAVLVPYVNAAETPDFPVRVFAPDEREGDYLSRVAERLMTGDGSRATRLAEGSVQQKLLNDFLLHAFGEAANALLPVADDALRAQEAPLEGFDLALFSFEREGDPHLCMARLGWKNVLFHRDDADEEGVFTARMAENRQGMPSPGGRDVCGFVINLSTGAVRLKDADVPCSAGGAPLFGKLLFAMEDTRTEKDAVKAVREALRDEAPFDVEPQVLEPAISRAMSRSIEETGAIDVESVAQEVFAGTPQGKEIARRVAERVQEEEVEKVIPVESRRVMNSLQKVKLRTDTGIAITLPASLAEDADSFSVINNEDGTISIYIGNIGELKTE